MRIPEVIPEVSYLRYFRCRLRCSSGGSSVAPAGWQRPPWEAPSRAYRDVMAVNICTTFGVWSKCFGEAINTGINTPEFLFSRVTVQPLSVAAARCGCQVSRRLWRGHGSALGAKHTWRGVTGACCVWRGCWLWRQNPCQPHSLWSCSGWRRKGQNSAFSVVLAHCETFTHPLGTKPGRGLKEELQRAEGQRLPQAPSPPASFRPRRLPVAGRRSRPPARQRGAGSGR